MIILISPAKTFSKNPSTSLQTPMFMKKSFVLQKKLKRLSIDEIMKHMNVSKKLANTVYDDYQNFNLKNHLAIESYYGQVYKAFDYESLSNSEKDYIQKHLYIISGLYGMLRPLDGISFYRLEIQDRTIFNLYDYWKPVIKKYIHEMHKDEIVISLLSNEYEKVIEDITYISINFTAKDNIHSMALKTLRGHFLRAMATHQIKNLNELKKVSVDGFSFDENLSTHSQYIFRRDEE